MFEIRKTKEKGYGVYALKDISPGTIIINESPILKVQHKDGQAQDADILHAFERLDQKSKDQMLSLHVDHRHEWDLFNTPQVVRVFHTNGFEGELFLTISRVNHACLANATMQGGTIIADIHIAAGEEVVIDYRTGKFLRMTSLQRKAELKGAYGFDCRCRPCADPDYRYISDMRRTLINVLQSALDGHEPVEMSQPQGIVARLSDGSIGRMNVPQQHIPLTKELSIHQTIEYQHLLAMLMEAESCAPGLTCTAYAQAALALLELQKRQKPTRKSPSILLFLEPYRCIKAWSDASTRIAEAARGPQDEWVAACKAVWQDRFREPIVGTVLELVSRDEDLQRPKQPIAVIMDSTGSREIIVEKLSRRECEELLRKKGKRLL